MSTEKTQPPTDMHGVTLLAGDCVRMHLPNLPATGTLGFVFGHVGGARGLSVAIFVHRHPHALGVDEALFLTRVPRVGQRKLTHPLSQDTFTFPSGEMRQGMGLEKITRACARREFYPRMPRAQKKIDQGATSCMK